MSLYFNASSSRAIGAALVCGLLLLAGCKQKQPVDQPSNLTAEPVQLPPAITKSQSFRCKDNSLVYVDFFADNLSVNLRIGEDGAIHHLVSATPGGPYSGAGYALADSGGQIQVTVPEKKPQSCKS